MSKKVRVGIVGTSWWADQMHLPSLKSDSRVEIGGICGQNPDRTNQMAQKYEISRIFADYLEMIEIGNLEALVVACPDHLHYPVTMKALEHGLHVVCEKPLALNSNQAEQMYKKAESGGVKHMVFFTARWLPHYRYIKKLIGDGFIGPLYHCHIHRFVGSSTKSAAAWLDGHWRSDPSRSNGILGDLGSHHIDLARWFFGEINTVSASLSTFVSGKESKGELHKFANNSAVLNVKFENGGQGILHVSAVTHVGNRDHEWHITLHGQRGTLQARFSVLNGFLEGIRANEQEYRVLPIPDSMWDGTGRSLSFYKRRNEIFTTQEAGDRLFIDAILNDRVIAPTFHDGLVVQNVIDAAIESHERGARISVLSG